MFGWELPPSNSGGLGVACFGLARALARSGVDVTFVLPQTVAVNPAPFKIIFADLAASASTTFNAYKTVRFFGHALSPFMADFVARVYQYAAFASRLARELQFDIIHVHDWLAIPAGVAAQETSGKPLIIHVHATEFDRSGGQSVNPVVYEIEKTGFARATLVITVSNYVKEILVSHYGVDPGKIRVVHNGVDREDYSSGGSPIAFLHHLKARGAKIILFVGRITIQKGPDYFLRAAKKVIEYFSDAYFVVAGSGDMENQMVNLAATLGISDHVLFTGFIRDEQIKHQLYRTADLFVLPSISEPFGLVPLESVINGTPVLISKQSGVSEVLSHALKVDFWDTDEMANQILSVIRYPALPETLKDHSQAEVARLNWSLAAGKVIEIYNQL